MTCKRTVAVSYVLNLLNSEPNKSLISLWWACLDSNQEPDRYERSTLSENSSKFNVSPPRSFEFVHICSRRFCRITGGVKPRQIIQLQSSDQLLALYSLPRRIRKNPEGSRFPGLAPGRRSTIRKIRIGRTAVKEQECRRRSTHRGQ